MPNAQELGALQIWETFLEEAGELLRRIDELLNHCAQLEPSGRGVLWLELRRALHTLKGAASAAGAARIKEAAHALEDRVGLESPADAQMIGGLVDAVAELRCMLMSAASAGFTDTAFEKVEPREASEAAPTFSGDGEYLRMRPERIDALHTLASELMVTRLQHIGLAERLLVLRDQAEEAQRLFRQLDAELRHRHGKSCALEWEDLLVRRTSVASILAEMAHGIDALSRELPTLNEQASVISANLEDGIRDLRLMPLQPFLRDYAQVVREAARESGKQAALVVQAEGAEIDRSVLLRLREPLLHLVRNAVVHGLEPKEQRLLHGKSETGRVLLEARALGPRVVICVSDDGRGVDIAAVRRKAQALHLPDPGDELSQEALLDLLSHPGFSTWEEADGLAGRGIGLDVARAGIQSLGGTLALHNRPGLGCTFTIEVSVSASTNIGLLLRVHDEYYGVLLNQIERVLRIAAEDLRSCEGRDVVDFNGSPIAAVTLAELLGLPASPVPAGRRPAVVLNLGKQRLVLIVDDIPGEQAMVIKPLGPAFSGAQLFLGGALQADHSIVPVLQVSALCDYAADRPSRSGSLGPAQRSSREPISVLVVDDSLTIRTLLRNILATAGYQVTVAHDGKSALEELDRLPRCSLIITDLQMPRMDGTALCRAVRSSSRPHLPILIVTSVGDEEEKRQALAAGADGYVVKAEFEQGRFLNLVAQLSSLRA